MDRLVIIKKVTTKTLLKALGGHQPRPSRTRTHSPGAKQRLLQILDQFETLTSRDLAEASGMPSRICVAWLNVFAQDGLLRRSNRRVRVGGAGRPLMVFEKVNGPPRTGRELTIADSILAAISMTAMSADDLVDYIYGDDPDGGPLCARDIIYNTIARLQNSGYDIQVSKMSGRVRTVSVYRYLPEKEGAEPSDSAPVYGPVWVPGRSSVQGSPREQETGQRPTTEREEATIPGGDV